MIKFIDSFEPYNLPEFELGVRPPEIKVSAEDKIAVGAKLEASNIEYLKKLCWRKCLQKIASGRIKQTKEECAQRLKMEFEVFEKTYVS